LIESLSTRPTGAGAAILSGNGTKAGFKARQAMTVAEFNLRQQRVLTACGQ
jgi:hypothetical protein